jgi:hypothetical protein
MVQASLDAVVLEQVRHGLARERPRMGVAGSCGKQYPDWLGARPGPHFSISPETRNFARRFVNAINIQMPDNGSGEFATSEPNQDTGRGMSVRQIVG